MHVSAMFSLDRLLAAVEGGYVRRQEHPTLGLQIFNYTEKATYEGAWDEVTRQCRGLILDRSGEVVARPFPKFFNYGEYVENGEEATLDLDAPAVVTDKLDGSLGILYPVRPPLPLLSAGGTAPGEWAIATRGSFTSDQALHATDLLRERYDSFPPIEGLTYLFEIVYPSNRIVVDYGETDDLFLLEVIETETGRSARETPAFGDWPGPVVPLAYSTLREALEAEPRPNAEGVVVYFSETGERVKFKQDDYVALHRILTGTNARHVWEVAAVQACRDLVREPKHWGSYLGIDPARAAEVLALGDEWLADVPDEFYGWVHETTVRAEAKVAAAVSSMTALSVEARGIADRRERFEYVRDRADAYQREVMRIAGDPADEGHRVELLLRAWREACPEPTAPFARSEAIA